MWPGILLGLDFGQALILEEWKKWKLQQSLRRECCMGTGSRLVTEAEFLPFLHKSSYRLTFAGEHQQRVPQTSSNEFALVI